jgi:hypothetical protein
MPALDFCHLILNRQWPPITTSYLKYIIFYKDWGDLPGIRRRGRDAPESENQPAHAGVRLRRLPVVFPENLGSGDLYLP